MLEETGFSIALLERLKHSTHMSFCILLVASVQDCLTECSIASGILDAIIYLRERVDRYCRVLRGM